MTHVLTTLFCLLLAAPAWAQAPCMGNGCQPGLPVVPDTSQANTLAITGPIFAQNMGITPLAAAKAATIAALPNNPTYNNGAAGIGATLIATSNGALTIDSYAPSFGDRIVVKNQALSYQNGIYQVISAGSVSTPYNLSRSADADLPSQLYQGVSVYTTNGVLNIGTTYTITTTTPIVTIGQTGIIFNQLTASTSAGIGLTVGLTTIAGGTSGNIEYNNGAVLGELATSGSGSVCLTTSCAMTTPALGTPSAAVLTNATGLPISSGVSGLGTGVATALGTNIGSAGSVVVNGGALGTPSSGTLTSATGLPVSTGISGLGTGVATALGANVGTAGAIVVNGGVLGTPSSGTLTNATGLPLTTGVTGILTGTNGGTGINNGANTLTLSGSYTLSGTTGSTLNIGSGGTLGSNAFTSTTYAPATSPTFTGTVTLPDSSTWTSTGISALQVGAPTGGAIAGIANVKTGVDINGVNALDGAAWTAYTPGTSCASGTLTSASTTGRYKIIGGKTTLILVTLTITTAGTCSGNVILTTPNTPNNSQPLSAVNANSSTWVEGIATTPGIIFAFSGTPPANTFIANGAYENQ